MCSWCWAFKPTWDKVKKASLGQVEVIYLLGGLASDSNEPMPIKTVNTSRETGKEFRR